MKTLFYYQIEPYKGHIPSDKVCKNNEPYESGFWASIIGKDITERWQAIRYHYKNDKTSFKSICNSINQNIRDFMKDKQQDDTSIKQFYLNFNADGIDCYVHRWNWKN